MDEGLRRNQGNVCAGPTARRSRVDERRFNKRAAFPVITTLAYECHVSFCQNETIRHTCLQKAFMNLYKCIGRDLVNFTYAIAETSGPLEVKGPPVERV